MRHAERRDPATAEALRRRRDEPRGRHRPQGPPGRDRQVGSGGRGAYARDDRLRGSVAEPARRLMTARVDASGVAVELPRPPRRIVSLVPSTTELLCALGLADALVGVTVYCVEPREVGRAWCRERGWT